MFWVELGIPANNSCSATNEKRRMTEGFGKLDERLARCNDDATGVVLCFGVRVGGELGALVALRDMQKRFSTPCQTKKLRN